MKNEFVPYDIALAMKELGFDENIELVLISYYYRNGELISTTTPDSFFFEKDEMIKAPLYQQAFRWFREKYNFVGTILGDGFNGELKGYYYSITEEGWINYYESIDDAKWYNTYEEAQDACLRKLIEIVKEKL